MSVKKEGAGNAPAGVTTRLKHRRVIEDSLVPDDQAAGDQVVPMPVFSESGDRRDFSNYGTRLKQYIDTFGGKKEYTATLYKFTGLSKQKQEICFETVNDMLSMHQVGVQFGSGDYRYLVTFPDDDKIPAKAFTFSINAAYDQLRKKQGLDPAPDPRGNGRSHITETMEIFKSFVELIKPLLESKTAPAVNPVQELIGGYSMMQTVLKDSLRDQLSFNREVIAGSAGAPADDAPAEDDRPDLVEKIFSLIEKVAPLVLGKPGIQTAAILGAAKDMPGVKKTIDQITDPAHREDYRKLVQALDKKYGAREVDKFITGLKLRRPA